MLLAAYLSDRATFDCLWKFAQVHMSTAGVMHWRIGPDGSLWGKGGATDADNDMAFALLIACGSALRAPALPALRGRAPLCALPSARRQTSAAITADVGTPSAAKCRAAARMAEAPPKAWDDAFRARRLGIFAFTVIAYSAYYLVRNSICGAPAAEAGKTHAAR